ncbi:hypothetical protein EC968_009977 [Mortierella alpina]|nr:hypothetical protein EC968_009977 [Mortierella alpina]
MALRSAAHRVFTIPELILWLSEHLEPYDLAQCTRVCKAWSRQLEPVLWTTFCLKEHRGGLLNGKRSSPFMLALRRNLPRIRTLKACYTSTILLQVLTGSYFEDPSTPCTNLRRLDFDNYFQSINLSSQYLPTLLGHNSQLTHLRLPFQALVRDALLVAVSKLDCLQHLSVYEAVQPKNVRSLSQILQACLPLPNLAELFFDLEFSWEGDDDWDSDGGSTGSEQDIYDSDPGFIQFELRAIVYESSKARFSGNPTATKIKSLQLPSNYAQKWNPLPLALLESDLLDLESFHVPWFERGADLEQIEQVVRKHCPNLKSLSCPSFHITDGPSDAVSAVIRGCSGLRSFVSDGFSDESRTRGRIISTLASHHSNTLEVLELTGCFEANGVDQQMVLSRCKKLKRFLVLRNRSTGGSASGIASTDILREKWVCMELKELGLTLNRFPKIDSVFLEEVEGRAVDMEDEQDTTNRLHALAAKIVYKQIGRLSKLEILVLDLHTVGKTKGKEAECAWDLTLSRGWLRELAGLKRLKTLKLKADLWSGMRQADVEFIHEQWPLLREISLGGDILRMDLQSPWLWLLNKRPYMHLVFNASN